MKFARKLVIAGLCSTAMTMPATAQEQDGAETDDGNIIIVTATRRAQDVQDIPIAVTAVGSAQLDAQGVVDVTDLGSVAPSFNVSQAQAASNGVVLRIRGVGTTSNNIGFESAVGVFIDGAYQSRPGVALSEFVDVERVEVLRGPQGTLFGRNTSAGALNVINRRPDLDEFGGFANAGYGNFDQFNLQGAINVPLVQDSLALRLTGAYRKRDGFITVLDGNGAEIDETNDVDRYLVRGQLGFATDGGIEGRLIADYSKDTSSCCGAVELLRSPIESAGLFNLVGLGPRGGMSSPVVANNPSDQSTAQQALDNRIVTLNRAPTADVENWGITGEIEVPISDNVDLIYIGSYREYEANESFDSDFSGLDVFEVVNNTTTIDTMTHELRLQGDALGGRLDWLIGAFYSDEDILSSPVLALGQDYGELVGATLFGPTGGMFGANPLTVLSGGFDPSTTITNNLFGQSSESFSVFTHNVFAVTDRLDLTLGLRYSDETKDGFFAQPSNTNPVCSSLAARAAAGAIPPALVGPVIGLGCFPLTAPADLPQSVALPLPQTFNTAFKDDELIYTAKLGYEFDNVNLYASYTHGYKSGGINLDATAGVNASNPTFASEEVDAYEIGLKGRFLNGDITANLAVFHQDFSDFQVLEFTGTQFQSFNVPKVKSTGIELEAVLRPTDGLTINTSLAYTDARYPNDCAPDTAALSIRNLCGFSLTNAPDIVAIVGANYDIPLTGSVDLFLNGQIRTVSDSRTSTQGRTVPTTAAALGTTSLLPFDVQDGYTTINLRVGIKQAEGGWAIEAWATNLTNEIARGVTFNTALRSGSRSAFISQEPRMYGVTLRGEF
ncbi:TonB-dependent receptor [Sphingorhabdus sp. EL138]|uniref:TonB-dependent receptor n=1 Tax=Sphingorhabdus sp. EL138 TaxID=2073156 RepID=UPI000D69A2B1|nr:TonB-dependent receptor [Sphingorhabdus sp. EL138]